MIVHHRRGSCGKRVEDCTLGNRISRTLCRGVGKDGLDPAQVCDLRAHIGQVKLGARLDLGAGLRAAVDEREQTANFLDRESQRTGAHDEAKTAHVAPAIDAIALGAPQRLGEQPGLLIVANGFEVAARGFRQIGALQPSFQDRVHFFEISLESVVATDLSLSSNQKRGPSRMSHTDVEIAMPNTPVEKHKQTLFATGGVVGAILASTCCVAPLLLLTLGISGAWIGTLTAFEPYKPYFAAMALIFIGLGFRQVYFKAKPACVEGSYCARPESSLITKTVLWLATMLVALALTINWWAPLFY